MIASKVGGQVTRLKRLIFKSGCRLKLCSHGKVMVNPYKIMLYSQIFLQILLSYSQRYATLKKPSILAISSGSDKNLTNIIKTFLKKPFQDNVILFPCHTFLKTTRKKYMQRMVKNIVGHMNSSDVSELKCGTISVASKKGQNVFIRSNNKNVFSKYR